MEEQKDPPSKYIKVAKVLILVIGISLIVSIIYVIWLFILKPFFSPILFYSYILFSLITLLSGLIVIKVTKSTINPENNTQWIYHYSALHKLRVHLAKFMSHIYNSLAWPITLLFGIIFGMAILPFVERKKVHHKYWAEMKYYQPMVSIFVLMMILLIYFFTYVLSIHWYYAYSSVFILLIVLLTRYLDYLINPESLPKQLRKLFAYPQIFFVLIVVVDLLSVILILSYIVSISNHTIVSFALIQQVTISLRKIQNISDITILLTLQPNEMLISLTGFLYLTVIGRSIFDFKRKPEDHREIAETYLKLGLFSDALISINKIKKNERHPTDKILEIPIYIGLNEIEKAFYSAKHYMQDNYQREVNSDEVFTMVISASLKRSLTAESLNSIIKRGIDSNVTDERMLAALQLILQMLNFPVNLLGYEFLTNELYLKYPLTSIFILIHRNEVDEAIEKLNSYKPINHVGEIQYTYLMFVAFMLKGEPLNNPTKIFEELASKYVDNISSHIDMLQNDWEKITCYQFIKDISLQATIHSSQREEQCMYFLKYIEKSISSDPDSISVFSLLKESYTMDVEKVSSSKKKIEMLKPAVKSFAQSSLSFEKRALSEQQISKGNTLHDLIDEEVQECLSTGNDAYEAKEYSQAIEQYKRCTQLNPNISEVWFNWGLTLYALNEFDDAIKKYTIALSHDRKNPIIHNNLGDAYYRLMEFKSAIREYDTALELDAKYLKAYYNRGLAFACLTQYKEAAKNFTEVISIEKDFAEAYNVRGLTFYYMNEYDKAIDDFNKAIELKEDFDEAYIYIANTKYALKDLGGALSNFDTALKLNEKNPEAYFYRGLVRYDEADYDKAVSDLTKSIELHYADLHEAYYWKGWSYRLMDDLENAVIFFSEAIKLLPEEYYYYSRGMTYHDLGVKSKIQNTKYYSEALSDYNKAIELNPDYSACYNSRGSTKYQMKNYYAAIDDYSKAIELKSPEIWYSYANRGSSYLELEKYEEARKDYENAIESKNDYDYAYFSFGVLETKLTRYKEALSCFNNAIELAANKMESAEYHAWRSVIYAYLNNELEALNDLELSLDAPLERILYNTACSYSVLFKVTKKEKYKLNAIDKLKDCLIKGYIEMNLVTKDPDWQHLINDEEFKKNIEVFDCNSSEI